MDEERKAYEERKKIYESTRTDLFSRQMSNSGRYDDAILKLSAGILGVSLAFIKDVIPLWKASHIVALELSWIFFSLSIITTLSSFMVSQSGIKKQLDYAEKYYLKYLDEYLTKKNWQAIATDYINMASGFLFVLGVVATVYFVTTNLNGGKNMSDEKKVVFSVDGEAIKLTKDGQTINFVKKIQGGVPIPGMQEVAGGFEKGAPIPSLRPVTPPAPPVTPPSSQGTEGSSGSPKGGNEKK